ncbi:hypothetical protein GEV29_04350 [Aeromicrobium sp. SMF47]|uniref:hypothetical protein n=1 Tax=Aeromicrobium yanjiei TaxID=2662028 RepID=UPI00129EB928|nr:hypothetical protein [Aeromicrobium yanjiei]MRJ75757.1 hypothetical protein [Aeromicrobium yanjiei]
MGRRAAVWVALGLMQLVVVVTLALAGPDASPHAAPIRIVAPPVVAASLVDSANALDGRPFSARALTTADEARASVASGRSVAAVVVDLRNETDVLYVASANGEDLNRAIVREVARVEGAYGRRADVRDVVRADRGDADHRRVYLLTGLAVATGLVVAMVSTWRRGPRSETLAAGAHRLAVNGAAAVVVGGLLAVYAGHAYGTDLAGWWIVLALTIFAVSATTYAFESLFGVIGIGVAVTVLVLAAAPLVTLVHPLLLPQPWAAITPWLPHGAALAAGTSQAYFGADQLVRPVAVLVAWSVLSVLTSIVARRERLRDAT